MEIIKELNKDDGIEFIKNGSITHAMNIVVSKDGNSIENEKSLETIVTLDENLKIVGIIPCATELVIFCDNNSIYRFDEETQELNQVTNSWNWYGGEVFGTYTYNVRGDLIVAISERNADKDVPLKVINLNNADLGSDDIYTLNPAIPQVTVLDSGTAVGGRMRVGTYLVFIRFEISNYEYTSWKDLGTIIYIDAPFKTGSISSITLQGSRGTTRNWDPTYYLNDGYAEDTDYASSSIDLDIQIDNKTSNKFKSFQIAYVCTYKDGIEAFNLGSYQFSDSGKYHITGNRNVLEKLSVDEVLNSANNFNIYNVKTMCNYGNRLYVANYKEESRKLDISKIDTSNIRVGVYADKDEYGNTLNYIVDAKPIEDEVYRFYVHYVYPDGSYTDGIIIENNNMRTGDTKKGVQITIGTYSNTQTGEYDRPIYMTCYDDTKVSDVVAAIREAKTNPSYPNYNDSTIKDKLGLIAMSETEGVDYYWFNLDPRFETNNTRRITYLCPYTNNNGDRLFRTPHRIKGNFVFDNIPMYEGFVGYFISYEEIDSIIIGDGIIDQHRDMALGASSTTLRNANFQSLSIDTVETQFYSEDIYVTKKGGVPNILIDLLYTTFKTRDQATTQDVSTYVTWDCFPGSSEEYTMANLNSYLDVTNSTIIALSQYTQLVSTEAGQYYKLSFYANGRKPTPVAINNNSNGESHKSTTIGRLLRVNQELYIQKDNVKLVRLAPNFYTTKETSSYGNNAQRQNVSGYTRFSSIFMFDGRGVEFAGEWQPIYAIDPANVVGKYYLAFVNDPNTNTSGRDMMHVNAVQIYKQVRYPRSAKIKVGKVPEVYFSYRDNSEDIIKNILNKQLTAATLYGLYELAARYSDYSRPLLNAYDPTALSNQIESYGKFIRRSNVIQSESTNNAWRQFPADGYKIISENKGDIINILGIGVYLIAHCEHSMFIFNRDSTLATRDKDVQMYMPDAFDTEYQEVFTSEKGYGGLQDFTSFTCNEVGYIFFDRSKRKIYRFDDKQLNDITDGIQQVIDRFLTANTRIDLGMDKEANRLLFSFTGEDTIVTTSYSFITNTWISHHDYFAKYFNTKTGLYITNDISKNIVGRIGNIKVDTYLDYGIFKIPTDKNVFYLGDKDSHCAVVDIVFNLQFETIKLLNYITYDIRKLGNINYSGDKILIFTNSCISSEWDISSEERNVPNLTKAYYEHGKWNFNYFRNLIRSVETIEPIDRITGKYAIEILDDEDKNRITELTCYNRRDSLINGKYIGIRFIIHQTDAKVTLSNVECYINKYRE